MAEDAYHFRWFQCMICGKMFDSEDAQEQHERKCRRESEHIQENERLEEYFAGEAR